MMGKFKGFTVKAVAVLIFALLIALFSVTITAQTDKDIAEDSEIALILSLASSGDTEYARQLLKDMRENRLDSVEMTLCDAYISAAEGNSRATAALLNKVAVWDAKSLDKKLLSLAKGAIGLKDYSSVEALTEYAKKVLERKLDGQKRVKKVATVLADADKVYDDYLRYNNYDKEAIEEILDELEDTIEKDPSFLDVPAVSLCRLKLLALVQDFRGIVRSISSKSSFEELAVAAELYMGGLVKDSNFEESYIGNYKEMCEKVVAQLEKVYDKIPNEKETLLKRVDTLIKSVENSSDYPAINKLKDDISVMARDEAFDDRSKAYIQLARIELQNGNAELAESSITQALGTVGACNDEEFTAPVHKIVDVITNKDNPEKLKDVVSYVDDIIENTSDEVIAEVVNSTAADNTESQENQDGQDFSSFMTDYVSRKRISLNFTSVNVP